MTLLVSKPPIEPYILPLLDNSLAYLSSNISDMPYQLTTSEQAISQGWDYLLPLVCWLMLGSSNSHATKDFNKDLAQLNTFISDSSFSKTCKHDILPSPEPVHDFYLRFEFLKAVNSFTDTALTISKSKNSPIRKLIPVDKVKKMKISITETASTMNKNAVSWRDKFKSEGQAVVNELLAGTATGDDVKEVLSETSWKTSNAVKDIVESAVDTLDGMTKMKL